MGALLTMPACGGNGAVPGGAYNAPGSALRLLTATRDAALPEDTTSILKKIKKDVVIGSSVDPKNGDKGPRGISVVSSSYSKLKKGQILVCNFEDKAGDAGKGTTVEVFNPTPGSKPATFTENTKSEGCSDDSISPANDDVYTSGISSDLVAQFSPAGKLKKTWGKPLAAPFALVDGACVGNAGQCGYSAEYIYASDAQTGGIVSFSVNYYGNPTPTEVVSGFAVNKKPGWSARGPSALAFTSPHQGTLFVADGPDSTLIAINAVTSLLETSEIVVKKGGKTFKCRYPHTSCAKLIKAGAPLDVPVAMTLLPNGNLIVANAHNNSLVELTTTGKVLATRVLDRSKTAAIFGVHAIGSNDGNTAIYYTNINDNSLHELEQ
ncbi:MAG: hypothetical protein WBE77_01375 [Candidatus Cybelea sp.]